MVSDQSDFERRLKNSDLQDTISRAQFIAEKVNVAPSCRCGLATWEPCPRHPSPGGGRSIEEITR
jgi:hypothetical protein